MTDLHGLYLPGAGVGHEQPAAARLQRELPGRGTAARTAAEAALVVHLGSASGATLPRRSSKAR
jgi:hypothetical protein